MKQLVILLVLLTLNFTSNAQNFDNLQTISYLTQNKKNIDLNFVLPNDWKIEKRLENQEVIVRKDTKNFITINILDYVEKPRNTICYNKAEYKILDTRLIRKRLSISEDPNIQEYLFRIQNATTFGPIYLNYSTTQEDLNKLEVEGSKAFYVKQNNEYIVKLPELNEVYELCSIINNIGPVNISNNFQYSIKSQASDEANQKIIDSIIVKSNLGNNLIPDLINQQNPITAISKTVDNSEKSNIYIFFMFFGLLAAFSFILVYMTRLRNIEK
jgi:hypothetical protein